MSQLQLNEPRLEYFEGRTVDKMPELIAKGMVPLSVAGLMQRKLQSQYGSEAVRNDLMYNNVFDTGDGIVYHPDGRIKIVPDAKLLREINSQSLLINGALVLPDGMYTKLEGHEFARKDIQKHVGNLLTGREAKSNPLWQALARDPKLLNEYVDLIFAHAKQQFRYEQSMTVHVAYASEVNKDAATMRLWHMRGLKLGSEADGGYGLDNSSGRLIGEALEAQATKSAVDQTLETRIALGQEFLKKLPF